MDKPTFESVKCNHPDVFRDTSWNNLINNMEFAVTATAYRLADLISLLPDTFSGSGAQFSQEELAAIGYNTPVPNMQAVATGQFRHDNGVPDVMGPRRAATCTMILFPCREWPTR